LDERDTEWFLGFSQRLIDDRHLLAIAICVDVPDDDSVTQAGVARLQRLMDDVTCLDIPDWRHRRVWSPVRETDLTAHGIVQIAHIFVRLLTEGLDRLPGVD